MKHTPLPTKSAYNTQSLTPRHRCKQSHRLGRNTQTDYGGLIEGHALVQGRNQTAMYDHILRALKSVKEQQ